MRAAIFLAASMMAVSVYIQELEINQSALLSALDVTRSPQPQVSLSNLKSVGGSDHGGYAFTAFI